MASSPSDPLKDVTMTAIGIVLTSAEAVVKKQPWTEEQMKLLGRAIGWLSLVTVGTEYDVLAILTKEAEAVKASPSKLPSTTPSKIPNGVSQAAAPAAAAAAAGKRRNKKMRGGLPPIVAAAWILGALALVFGGNQAVTIMNVQEQQEVIRKSALDQISSACPSDLNLPVGPAPLFDWGGTHALALRRQEAKVAACNAAKAAAVARVAAADAEVKRAYEKIPSAVGVITTSGAVIAQGAAAGTPAGIAAAGAAGKAAAEVTQFIMDGTIPKPAEFASLVDGLNAGFSGSAGEEGGTTGGRRKTRKPKSKRRTTRRAPLFRY